MTNLFKKTGLAAVTLAAATLLTPALAQASDYRYDNCKDTENAVAGAAVGGSLGAVIGEGIAGRGDRTEGAILGAIIGGIAGAAIGDGVNDCEKYNSRRRGYTTTTPTRGYSTGSSRGYRSGVTTVGYHPSSSSYGTSRGRGHSSHGYNDRGYDGYDSLSRIDRRIDQLRRERDQLNNRRGYRHDHYAQQRLDQISRELHSLKKQRKYAKKNSRSYRDYRPATRRGHYHGSTVCYSGH